MKRLVNIILCVCLILPLVSCGDPQKNGAEDVLRLYLADNEELYEAYHLAHTPGAHDTETPIREVLKTQAGELVSEEFIEDFARGSTFSTFSLLIWRNEFTAKIKTMSLEECPEGYLFDTVVRVVLPDGSTMDAFLNGTVELDETGKIRNISLGGTGMEELMKLAR